MKNPLVLISDWLLGFSDSTQNELVGLCVHFHPDQSIEENFSPEEETRLFKEYLKPEGLSGKEVVLRTLAITRLIEFAIDGRDTQDKWLDMMNTHLELRSKAKAEGRSTMVHDNFLNRFQETKDTWIDLCNRWQLLRLRDLTDKKIGDWYFFGRGK